MAVRELTFEVTKYDDKKNPLECKLTAVGDHADLQKAFKELSLNVMKANEDKK